MASVDFSKFTTDCRAVVPRRLAALSFIQRQMPASQCTCNLSVVCRKTLRRAQLRVISVSPVHAINLYTYTTVGVAYEPA